MWVRGLCLFIFLLQCALVRGGTLDYSELPLSEQRDFMEYARRAFVLGEKRIQEDPQSHLKKLILTTSLKRQADEIETLKEIFQNPRAPESMRGAQIRRVLQLQNSLIDWTYEFRSQISSKPQTLARLYASFAAQTSNHTAQSASQVFEAVMQRLAFQIDLALIRIRYPLMIDYSPSQGTTGPLLNRFIQIHPESFLNQIPQEIFEKLRTQQLLSFEDFRIYLEASKQKADLQISLDLYSRYLFYGSLDFSQTRSCISEDEFVLKLETQERELQRLAAQLKLKAPQRDPASFEKMIYALYRESRLHPWSPDWTQSWDMTRTLKADLVGLQWLQLRFPELKIGDQNHTSKAQEKILDEKFNTLLPEEAFFYHAADLQLKKLDLDRKSFAYYRLSEEGRSFFLAKEFPDLLLSESSALVEMRFFELSEDQRLHLLETIYGSQTLVWPYFERLSQIDLSNSSQTEAYQLELLRTYLSSKEPTNFEKSQAKTRLLDGSEIPRADLAKEKMRLDLKTTESTRSSFYPTSFLHWLAAEFFPYPEYGSDEIKRFTNEWARRSRLSQVRSQLKELETEYQRSLSEEEKQQVAQRIESILKEIPSELYEIQSGSYAVFMASFLSGAIPRNLEQAKSIAASLGVGALFYVVSKTVGGKALALFILGDTGLRLVSSYYLSRDQEHLLDLDLNKGISSPLGYFTAAMLKDLAQTTEGLFFEDRPAPHLEAFHHAGEICLDLVSLALGSQLTSLFLDLSKLSAGRKIRGYEKRIHEFETAIGKISTRIESLTSELAQRKQKRNTLIEQFGLQNAEVKRISLEIAQLEIQISQAQSGILARYQGRIEFFLSQLLKEAARLATLDFRGGIKKLGLLERFKRSQYWGRATFEREILELQAKIDREIAVGMIAENSSAWSLKRRKLKQICDSFLNSQNLVSSKLLEFEALLKSSEKIANRTERAAQIADALPLFRDALRKWREPLAQIDSQIPKDSLGKEAFTQRFMAESYVRLSQQVKALRSFYQGILESFSRDRLPWIRDLSEKLDEIEELLLRDERALQGLEPIFSRYISETH